MLQGGIPFGKIFGIELRLNYSWFIVFGLITWALTASYFPSAYPHWSLGTRLAAGIITSLLFFISVLAHELMHSVVAQSRGIPVKSITLFIFGGVSQITEEPKEPMDEFRMAIAGPLTSLGLGILFWILWFALQNRLPFLTAISFWLGYINLSLGIFNLIPGFPLDGGRVLRSILWGRSHNLRKATHTATNIGRGVGYLFIFVGIGWIFWDFKAWYNGVWLAFIGWFLENAAVGSYRQMTLRDILQGHKVSEIMTQDCLMVPPDITIEKLVNEHMIPSGRRCFPVVQDNRVLGLITLANIKAIPQPMRVNKTVKNIMTPFDKLKWVGPDADLAEVMNVLAEEDLNQLPVVEDHTIVGMIARDRLLAFINVRAELGM